MQLQVAAELGVNASTISQWRRGVGMSGDVALRIACWLRVDLRDFAKEPADPLPETQRAA